MIRDRDPAPRNDRTVSGRGDVATRRRILIATDSWKGSWTAQEAAELMSRAWRAERPTDNLDLCPVADGGEGTLDVLCSAWSGRIRNATITGPLGKPHRARWGWVDGARTAIIELAEASGLLLVTEHERDPTRTTTFGTGKLIREAIAAGAVEILIGIGGSATCDGGAGLVQALGVRFHRADGSVISEPMCGKFLGSVAKISGAAQKLPGIRVLADVTNPLLGADGTARVFGPQKGATREQVDQLEAGLEHLVTLLGPRAVRLAAEPGAGAAGGVGFGLRFWSDAETCRGIDGILDAVRFDERLRAADLVITGEGRLDRSSLSGKATVGIAQRASANGVRAIAIVGSNDLKSGSSAANIGEHFADVIAADEMKESSSSEADRLIAAVKLAAQRWGAG